MTTTTFCGSPGPLFRAGDRIEIGGYRAVVRAMDGTIMTFAYREAWYWRLAWRAQDALAVLRKHIFRMADAVLAFLEASADSTMR